MEEQLVEMLTTIWDAQRKGYDLTMNYPELCRTQIASENIEWVTGRCREILENESPPHEPEIEDMFRDDTVSVPNNIVISAVLRALFAGGKNARSKPGGWKVSGNCLIYEVSYTNAGTITVSTEESWEFVESLNVFTADVLISLLGQICSHFCANKTDSPLTINSLITVRKILGYKDSSSRGAKYWAQWESVNKEIEKLQKLTLKVKNSNLKYGQANYESNLLRLEYKQRVFNPTTRNYTPCVWNIKPGSWASQYMSKGGFEFIGRLSKDVFALDHREIRKTHQMAKRLMYTMFVIPGGTHIINQGARRSFAELLKLTGEHLAGDVDKSKPGRSLERLGKAIDYLVENGFIETDIQGKVSEFIDARRKPWGLRPLLDQRIALTLTMSPT